MTTFGIGHCDRVSSGTQTGPVFISHRTTPIIGICSRSASCGNIDGAGRTSVAQYIGHSSADAYRGGICYYLIAEGYQTSRMCSIPDLYAVGSGRQNAKNQTCLPGPGIQPVFIGTGTSRRQTEGNASIVEICTGDICFYNGC